MSDIKKILAEWGINAVALAAGLVGSIVILTMSDKPISFKCALAQLSCGIAFAGYGTTVVVDLFRLTSSGWIGVMGLILGLIGMYIALGLVRLGKRFSKDPIGTVKDLRNAQKQDTDVDDN